MAAQLDTKVTPAIYLDVYDSLNSQDLRGQHHQQ